MEPLKMKTEPVEPGSERASAGETPSPAEKMQAIQADLAGQYAASAARFGAMVGKSIELTEAGMTIGLKLLNSGGERLLSALSEKIAHAIPPAAGAAPNAAPESPAPAPVEPLVYNSVRIVPGGEVYIPFSISNDAADRTKSIRIDLGTLNGEQTSQAIERGTLTVTPKEKTIVPLDFEKFVVSGRIPDAAAPDSYIGWIEVTGDEQFRIRVIVTIGSPDGA